MGPSTEPLKIFIPNSGRFSKRYERLHVSNPNVIKEGQCSRHWSELSGFEPWPGTLCCVVGQDT